MEWSTVVALGIAAVFVLGLLYLGVALYTARIARRQMDKMHEDFEERRRGTLGGRR